MAKKSRATFQKREKERARQHKQHDKQVEAPLAEDPTQCFARDVDGHGVAMRERLKARRAG